MNALKLLATPQTGGDSPVEVLVEGLQGRSTILRDDLESTFGVTVGGGQQV